MPKVPSSIPGLTPLESASDATKALWHRMPRLVRIKPVAEQVVYCAVLKSIKTLSFHAYKNGLPVHGAGLREHTKAERNEMTETAHLSIYQATAHRESKSTTQYSECQPLCSVLNVWIKSIALLPPTYLNSTYLLCGDTTQLGVNITPEGSFVDLHYDIGRSGYSMVYGLCEKVLILFPPTEHNLSTFAKTAGLHNRLARIGDKLEGGLVVRINSSLAIDLPSGALHAVFTTAGGFLGGINFSIVEELTIMAQAILAQLPFFSYSPDAILEDIKVYLSALQSALDLGPPHNILAPTIESWLALELSMALIDPLSRLFLEEKERILAALNALRLRQCTCGAIREKETHLIEEHFKSGHRENKDKDRRNRTPDQYRSREGQGKQPRRLRIQSWRRADRAGRHHHRPALTGPVALRRRRATRDGRPQGAPAPVVIDLSPPQEAQVADVTTTASSPETNKASGQLPPGMPIPRIRTLQRSYKRRSKR
ncbi:hypothetical protein ACLOAV_010565 [Pseudogymnoascus australis]